MRSLEIAVDHPPTGYCASTSLPLSNGFTIAWRTALQPLPVEVRPSAIFERIVRANTKPSPREQALRQSVIDLVYEDAKAIQLIRSNFDRRRMHEFPESVRGVERRLERAEAETPRLWAPPTRPSEDLQQAPPAGVPHSRPEHIKLLTDLLVLALWTETTRVSNFMLGASQCNAYKFDLTKFDPAYLARLKDFVAHQTRTTWSSNWPRSVTRRRHSTRGTRSNDPRRES